MPVLNSFRDFINTNLMPLVAPLTRSFVRPLNPNIVPGYIGAGSYVVQAPQGLNLRQRPTSQSGFITTLPYGTVVEVVGSTPNGWVEVSYPVPQIRGRITGYLCMTCAEAPGGPWLLPAYGGSDYVTTAGAVLNRFSSQLSPVAPPVAPNPWTAPPSHVLPFEGFWPTGPAQIYNPPVRNVSVPSLPAGVRQPAGRPPSYGYAGPGPYQVTSPSGLRIRSAPSIQGGYLDTLPMGKVVSVVSDAGGGWFEVLGSPGIVGNAGFMCASCPEAGPGGPWLVPLA